MARLGLGLLRDDGVNTYTGGGAPTTPGPQPRPSQPAIYMPAPTTAQYYNAYGAARQFTYPQIPLEVKAPFPIGTPTVNVSISPARAAAAGLPDPKTRADTLWWIKSSEDLASPWHPGGEGPKLTTGIFKQPAMSRVQERNEKTYFPSGPPRESARNEARSVAIKYPPKEINTALMLAAGAIGAYLLLKLLGKIR